VILPGWTCCVCFAFNSEETMPRDECRVCGEARKTLGIDLGKLAQHVQRLEDNLTSAQEAGTRAELGRQKLAAENMRLRDALERIRDSRYAGITTDFARRALEPEAIAKKALEPERPWGTPTASYSKCQFCQTDIVHHDELGSDMISEVANGKRGEYHDAERCRILMREQRNAPLAPFIANLTEQLEALKATTASLDEDDHERLAEVHGARIDTLGNVIALLKEGRA